MLKYKQEQLWSLYEDLPMDLKEAIFSEKIADTIYDVCVNNDLKEEKIVEVTRQIGYVLLGLLSPKEFSKALKEELKLKDEIAEKINWEIQQFIFFPLRTNLEIIYKITIEKIAKSPEKSFPKEELSTQYKTQYKRDIYREPIE